MTWIHAVSAYEKLNKVKNDSDLILTNACILTPKGIKNGSLVVQNGLIADILNTSFPEEGEDLMGDLLIPGFIELHTDNLEKHIMPRPGIYWTDPLAAVEAHDAQLVSSGITTVYDSVCVGEPVDRGRKPMLSLSLKALEEGKKDLRGDHLLHLRCEVSDPLMCEDLDEALSLCSPNLISIMDHTPGQRQWRKPEDWLIYHQAKLNEEELYKMSKVLKEARDSCADKNIQKIASYSNANKVPLASHDDTDRCHVEDAVALGARISEFPTTMEAAKIACEMGLYTVMGTPNLVRGSSHSGNVKAKDVAMAGYLSCLSSDYVPGSLLHGAFMLYKDHGFSLIDAINTITKNPGMAGGLSDRGEIAEGLRGDLVRVKTINGRPKIMSVWVKGERVF
jgi:alpha-D-ribose 1-methylphosphonate 5-triphosphate diphosphatase